jgi:hypothetical protein
MAASGKQVVGKEAALVTIDNQMYSAYVTGPGTWLFYLAVLAFLFWGLRTTREAPLVVSARGFGYALGVAGGGSMCMTALYSLRKRSRALRWAGPNRFWFQSHMVLGILGPVAILYHANFRISRDLNSRVAILATLIIPVAGFIGRYVYTGIHWGLFNRRVALGFLQKEDAPGAGDLLAVLESSKVLPRLAALEQSAMITRDDPSHGFFHFVMAGARTRLAWPALTDRLKQGLDEVSRVKGWSAEERDAQGISARRYIRDRQTAILRVCEYSVFECVFSLWHLFHIPFIILLVLVTLLHVVAVHIF